MAEGVIHTKRTKAFTFMVVAFAGLVLWLLAIPTTTLRPVGDGLYSTVFLTLRSAGIPLLLLTTAVAGYLVPNGFWLWGVAAVSLRFIASYLFTLYMGFSGQLGPLFDTSQIVWQAVLEFGYQFAIALICTMAALLGAGLKRFISQRLTRSIRT